MAAVNKTQLKELSADALKVKLEEVKKELLEARTSAASSTRSKNTAKIKQLRHLQSRVLNYLARKTAGI